MTDQKKSEPLDPELQRLVEAEKPGDDVLPELEKALLERIREKSKDKP